jgi:hypothetical protein
MRLARVEASGMFARAVRPRVLALCLLAALAAAGCGGKQQDADEPSGEFPLEVVSARFPTSQTLAQPTLFVMRVRNTGDKEIPNLAVTVTTDASTRGDSMSAFGQNLQDQTLADRNRPVWIVDKDPTGGQTAYTNTWAFGPIPAGATKTVRWRVTAVRAGDFVVRYRVAPGLNGKARSAAGSKVSGSFRVKIDNKPVAARVDENGRVVRGGD